MSSISTLFPFGTVAEELLGKALVDGLKPAEMDSIRHASEKRFQDFVVGRHCARKALARLGFSDCSLPMLPDRTPAWPAGVTGCISHTAGYCAAVVARKSICKAVGVDIEVIEHVTPDIWPAICTDDELDRVASLKPEQARLAMALIFSAKEAYYKCQYPITKDWVEFSDATVKFRDLCCAFGAFSIIPRKKPVSLFAAPLKGRWMIRDGFVVTGLHIPAS